MDIIRKYGIVSVRDHGPIDLYLDFFFSNKEFGKERKDLLSSTFLLLDLCVLLLFLFSHQKEYFKLYNKTIQNYWNQMNNIKYYIWKCNTCNFFYSFFSKNVYKSFITYSITN